MYHITIVLFALVYLNAVEAYPKFKGIEASLMPKRNFLRQEALEVEPGSEANSVIQLNYYLDKDCLNLAESQLFSLNQCGSVSNEYFMKFHLGTNKNNYIFAQSQLFHDSQCLQPVGVESSISSPISKCVNNRIINVLNDLGELPKSKPKVMFALYDNEQHCTENDITKGLLQANLFSTGKCIPTSEGDYYFDNCADNIIKGHSFTSTDGSCSGLSEPFTFTPTNCKSNNETISDYDHFGFIGHLTMKCLA